MAWFDWFFILFIIAGGVGAGYFIIIWRKHDTLLIKDPSNDSNFNKMFWVIPKIDKDSKVKWWISPPLFPKIKIEYPPKESRETMLGGRVFAIAERLSEDEFRWLKKTDSDAGIDYIPFTTTQRDTVVNQFIKAKELEVKGKWTPDKITAVASMGALVILAICLMIFWGDIAKPGLEMNQNAQATLRMAQDIQKTNIQMLMILGYDTSGLEVAPIDISSGTQNQATNQQGTERPPVFDTANKLLG